MKLLRPLLIISVVLLVLVAVAVGVALTPSVQRWAVLRAARAQPGLKLEVGSVAAGISHLRLAGLRAEKKGVTLQLEQLDADYSPWQLVARRRLVLGHVRGQGLVVDAGRLSADKAGAAAAGAPAAAPGVLARLELPFGIVLDDAEITGRALFPGTAGGAPLPVEFKLSGGKFAPGQDGQLVLAATVKNPAANAPVSALRTQVTLQARQTDHQTFDRVAVTAVIDAEGAKLSGQQQLKIAAELVRTAAGENYSFSVDTLLAGKSENLLAVQATLAAGGHDYAGDWKLLARTAQLEPFFLGAVLPDFDARGGGRFTFNPATVAGSLQGGIEAEVRRLEAIEPSWRAFGPVKAIAKFDVAEADGIARLNQLTVSLAGEQPVLELSAARAAQINFKARRLQVGDAEAGEALNLTLHGLPLAWVRPFVKSVDVSGGMVTCQLAITGEPDRLLLRAVEPLRVQGVTVVQAGTALLTRADLTLGFEAVLTPEELQATVKEFSLKTPAGDALVAQAKVTLPVAPDPAVTVVATYQADLPTLLAPWLPLGRVKAAGDADFTLAGPRLEVRRLQTTVTDAAGIELFKAAALRAFVFDLVTRQAEVAGATGTVDLVRVNLGHVPLAALPLNRPGTQLGGVVEQGEFLVSVDGPKLVVFPPTPFRLADVLIASAGQPAFTGLAVEARPLFELSGPASARFETGEMTIRTAAGATLMTAKGELTQAAKGLQGSLTFVLEVPALGSQPMFAGAQAVTAGRASGEVRGALGSVNQLEARLTVNGLVAAGAGDILPVANLSLRAVAHPNGKFSVQAPLLLDRSGQRSDLNFSLEVVPSGRGFSIDGALRGEHVELADALAVLGVFSATVAGQPASPAAPAAVPAKLVADPMAAWSRVGGRLALDIKSVVRGSDWSMNGLTGLMVIESGDVTLQKLEATFGDKGRLAAKALLSFTAGPRPYELTGDFSLTEFDAGRLFKAIDPSKPATVEGIFTVNGKFSGDGETLDATVERTRGTFELTSRTGVFRGLQRTSSKISMTSKAVEIGASVLGSLFGTEKATKTAEKVAGQAYFVDQLAQNLGELNYDQLSVKLSRDETLNIALEDISLVSSEIRLIGKGTVTHVSDRPLLEQPLTATLSIAGRGKIEELLGKLRLLNGTKDELGYAKAREAVTLGGTLAKPDPSAFFSRIATAKLGDLLAPEN